MSGSAPTTAPASGWGRVMRRKPVSRLNAESGADSGGSELRRSLGVFRLTMIGVGSTVGTGIFIVLNEAVPKAGPAVVVSFVLAAITAALTALCYAELASTIPVSGASYTYAYATMGELIAFIVGACLLLEYGVAASAVAVGWGEYLNALLGDVTGWQLPAEFSAPPGEGGILNVPAAVLVTACCLLLVRGAKESATINAITVCIKLAVLLLFVAVAFTAFNAENAQPFAPFGAAGVGAAASMVFFSYIGMDTVSTAGEEVRNPRRTLPLALFWCVVIVTSIYLLVAIAGIGAQPWQRFEGQQAGLAAILGDLTGSGWPAIVLAAGGVVSIFGVTLTTIYGQTRILFSMGRDGMVPKVFHTVHPRRRTPVHNTLIVSLFVGLLAAVVPLNTLANLTSMGTLVAFTVVSAGVVILRRTRPDLDRGFRAPGGPVVPALSIAACVYLISQLPWSTYLMFAIWLALALTLYFTYSVKHSTLATGEPRA
ncbi:amino acid/polyamine/organocation transporter, APC superfamily (TC 2.A.3) [Saccharopolyspora kobensis]|uniref:Amino acid/polyamine/organocation transporter, APC superfamily n=1 Tax=Saccharopolyspora kobensis TaxID=146035 RepID=A0A1H6AUH0_9PSEU|nr:amino acid permease [Saccharopolyspora kobensis]SEG51924.1 amino acid/polyamine/organocation transporter, APC superfamily (TC 2.A.3) [Saccharopolyspora kobensis]SFE78814.1 amino acid/polyamine/organocation transporter, APC superfamily [Saccharopolyspora kobensis]